MSEYTEKVGRRSGGFTLVELVVVVTLLAILGMTVTPIFKSSFASIRGDHAMRDLFAVMKAAQADAIVEAVEYRLYLDTELDRYWLERGVYSREGYLDFERVAWREGIEVLLPDSLDMVETVARKGEERGTSYIAFYPSGACDVGEVLVQVSGSPREVYRIATTGTLVTFEAPEV